MSTETNIEKLVIKAAEFHQCAMHIHMRGMGEIFQASLSIVDLIKQEGKTFDDILEHMKTISNGEFVLEKDPFFQKIQICFNKEPKIDDETWNKIIKEM